MKSPRIADAARLIPWAGAAGCAALLVAGWVALQPDASPPAQPSGSAAASETSAPGAMVQLAKQKEQLVGADLDAPPEEPVACVHGHGEGCSVAIEDDEEVAADVPTGRPLLLEFSSAFCAACDAAEAAVTEAIEKCNTSGDLVEKVDVDAPKGAALAKHFDVTVLPTFLSVDKDGEEQSRLVGKQATSSLVAALDAVRPCPYHRPNDRVDG